MKAMAKKPRLKKVWIRNRINRIIIEDLLSLRKFLNSFIQNGFELELIMKSPQ